MNVDASNVVFWIGLNDIDNDNDYNWIDGSDNDYVYGALQFSGGDCVEANNQPNDETWVSVDCDLTGTHYFVCNGMQIFT